LAFSSFLIQDNFIQNSLMINILSRFDSVSDITILGNTFIDSELMIIKQQMISENIVIEGNSFSAINKLSIGIICDALSNSNEAEFVLKGFKLSNNSFNAPTRYAFYMIYPETTKQRLDLQD